MSLLTLEGQIKNPRSRVFRKLEVKRRQLGTGTYEDSWQDISKDVVKWGNVRKEIDATRIGQFKFANLTLVMSNQIGKYNPSNDENSFWYGYGSQQRSLIRISAGFIHQTQSAAGIWTRTEIPTATADQIVFSGYISGDINVVGNNQVNIPVVPLTECFRQFSASRLTGYNNSLTASDFITMLRDQQDTNSNYIFRPFFGDTTANWLFTATTNEFKNLDTATNEDLTNITTWDVIQKLGEAENTVPYVTADGVFKFLPRSTTTTTVYHFFGPGAFSSQYGTTIKKVNWYGQRFNKYYSRVTVKWAEPDTTTSYETRDSQYLVSGDSGPWTLGERTLAIENTWIPTATTAETIAESLFQEFSAIKFELDFTTSFIPHIEVFDKVLVTYDQGHPDRRSLWDLNNWADTAGAALLGNELWWDDSQGDALKLYNTEFTIISVDLNLDNLESKFIGRASG